MSGPDDRTHAHVIVRGRVQGVYFRGSLKQQADLHAVSGWVRNRPDGAVEAVLQGPRGPVLTVVEWMRTGPGGARVDSADVDWSQVNEPLQSFKIVG
jgi:acylphosphatase